MIPLGECGNAKVRKSSFRRFLTDGTGAAGDTETAALCRGIRHRSQRHAGSGKGGLFGKDRKRTGARLLANASVATAIAERVEKRSRETAIDAAWVLREAQSVYQAARSADRLPDALRALELIGKHVNVQAFMERVDHRHVMSIDEAMRTVTELLPKYAHLLPAEAISSHLRVIDVRKP